MKHERMPRLPRTIHAQDPEHIATEALSYIAQDPALLDRFLALSGIAGSEIRRAGAEPGFLAGVLDFLLGSESDVIALAAHAGIAPAAVVAAREELAGGRPD